MRFLRTNTAVRVTVGPFFDKTDGVTPETAITVTACKLTLMVDDANVPTLVLDTNPTASGGANDMVHVTGDDAGFYDLELAAANVNYLGRAMLAITDAAVHCPVFHEFMILPAMIYDSLVLGTDDLDTNTKKWNDLTTVALPLVPATAGRTLVVDAAGLADANMVKAGPTGAGTAQTARDLGASVLLSSGSGTGQIDLSSGKVLLQATQAGVTIPTVTTLTNAPPDSTGVTTLLSRIPAALFSGITSLAQWLGLMAGKQTGNSTARTELRATGAGSGTYDETTDSLEANRDNLGTNGAALSLAKTTNITGFNDLSAAQVNTEADTALADVGVTTTVTGRIDVAVSTRLAAASYTTPPTVAAIGAQITSDHGAGSYIRNTEPLDAAGTRAAVGLASANLDTQLGDLPTNAELAAALGTADDAVLAAIAALNDLSSADVAAEISDALTVDVLADSIPADGSAPTLAQAAYMLTQFMLERSVSGTTVTVKKPDGSTTLFTLSLNSATSPTSITRAT